MCLDHVRQLTRSRKLKHKEGRGTSHSYWSDPWSKGDYPRHIREASMAMDGLPEGLPPYGTSGRRPWRWMVSWRGFLLPAHSGGVHVDGWSPGGGSSFRQGAGAASPGNRDLETAAAAVQRGVREKEIDIRGFHPEG